MPDSMRVMSEQPLNAETPTERLRSWITANDVFFDRNQGRIPRKPVDLDDWALTVDGEIKKPLRLTFDELSRMPRTIVSNTLECSGNGRSLLNQKASGNPWTIGGVGNAVWCGVWLNHILSSAGLTDCAAHVAFEGMDTPLGKSKIKFIRSIPIAKAMESTLLAYEMNGEPLPLKHGYPLRALALGWTGANCVKWLKRIAVLDRPYEGFFMDKVYRVFQKNERPESGEVVKQIKLKAIITRPLPDQQLEAGQIIVLGAAYAGEEQITGVEVSTDKGLTWHPAELIGPHEPFAWRQWQYRWEAVEPGVSTLQARASDSQGRMQPDAAQWNVLGYGNNGVQEHAIQVTIV